MMTGRRFSLFYFLFCFFLLWLLPGTHYGQEKRYANGLYLERFSLGEGLPSQSTHCLASSRHGELWMGSSFGLVQYDGYNFQLYPFSDASLPVTFGAISQLCEDSSGNLWFTVENRTEIFRFVPKLGFYQYFAATAKNIPPPSRITALAATAENELWIGTASTGLYHFQLLENVESGEQEAKWRHLPSKNGQGQLSQAGPLSNQVNALQFHPNGNLWIATEKGLSRIKAIQKSRKTSTFEHFFKASPDAAHTIQIEAATALGLSPSGGIWIGGRTTGTDNNSVNAIAYYHPASGHFQTLPGNLVGRAPVSSLLESIKGHLYIGTLGDGLYTVRHARGTLKGRPAAIRNYKFEPPAAWNDAFIEAIVQGPFENIWLATSLTGLYKLNPY
ncbi:MAG: hypothetical protein KDD28_01540, partial [Phaeodactylibacter sp.]|nr:hypothetical protein [Phaeodactylibacter sp.]